MKTSLNRAALSCALLASTCLAAPALAQTVGTGAPAVRQTIDDNGVNLISGKLSMPLAAVSLGTGDSGVAYRLEMQDGKTYGNIFGWVTTENSVKTVVVGASSEKFSWNGSAWVPLEGRGSTFDGTNYQTADGTVFVFSGPSGFNSSAPALSEVRKPDGEKLTYYFLQGTLVTGATQYGPITQTGHRLSSIVSSSGYQIQVSYKSNTLNSSSDIDAWHQVRKAKLINTTVEVCNYVMAEECSTANVWPSLENAFDGATNTGTYTDTIGRVARFSYDGSGRLIAMRYFGSNSDNISIGYDGNGRVGSVTKDGVATSYAYSDSGSVRTTTVTLPGGASRVMTFDLNKLTMLSHRDEMLRTTQYQYDSSARPTLITAPEGNSVQYGYDARGNVTQTIANAKNGSLAAITTSASYPASCANRLTCNKPVSTTDARGHTTSYSWDGTHGSLLTVTAPAVGGVSPQTRYSFTALQAVYKQPGGTVSGNPIYKLTAVSSCQTSSSCAGGAEEVRTTIAYDLVGGYRNLFPTSVSTGAGNGSLTATVASGYDRFGNVQTVDGPLGGTADTARTRYDNLRRPIASVSPDPDGGGALKHRVSRTTYNGMGLAVAVEAGTANGQSDADIDAMSVLERAEVDYDANGRPVTRRLIASGAVQAVTQTSYDARGRSECSALRMNPNAFGSLPGACSLSAQGSFGPDRISRTHYNAASDVTKVQIAYGTADQADEVTNSYTSNGKLQSVTDAENNKTSYVYDGHDRLYQAFLPSTAKGSGSSSGSDYEQYGYDAGGNVTSRRLRDGQWIYGSFDALGRATSLDTPNAVAGDLDRSYGYDLLGRLTSAAQSGQTLSFAFDALGRQVSASGPLGSVGYQYDAGGRRTRTTWADGFFVTYDHNTAGQLTAIRENGSFVLASYGYDDRGRRTGISRGNGTSQSFGYDAVSRLSSLTQDLGGGAHDQTLGFSYNPAGQIIQNTRSNDVFAWTAHYNVDRNYGTNGLNQLTSAGSIIPTYDGRGNLTSAGSTSYSYTAENRLVGASNGASLRYDPMGRLYETAGGTAGTTRFAYDGENLIAEYNGSNGLVRRYVHGPGADEPVVWYEGSGTGDRRWLHADERGSVVAVTDGGGNAIAINRYDEYGIPQSTNLGRFQYTGQTWLPELGMYYYKARIYSPTLGRFLQTDPIRYGGGMNMYAYVGGDPVNGTDPSGLLDIRICRSVPVSVTIEQDGASPPSSGRRPTMKQICDNYHIPEEHFGLPYQPYFPVEGAIPDSFPTRHEYIVNNKVAPANQCSAGEFADGLKRHIVPGVPSSQPIQDAQRYTARDMGLSVFGWAPGGPVTSYQIGDTHFRNQTVAGHPLHNGSVDRIAYQSGGDWYVATIGVGVNTSPLMALVNETRGPAIFNNLDRDLAAHLKATCDGK